MREGSVSTQHRKEVKGNAILHKYFNPQLGEGKSRCSNISAKEFIYHRVRSSCIVNLLYCDGP